MAMKASFNLNASGVETTPKLPAKFKYYQLNGKRLAVEIKVAGIDLRDANIIFIKSPKGTGKTKFLTRHLKSIPKHYRILSLVHRRSLAKALSNELSLDCYLDVSELQDGYVISVDSLKNINTERDKPYDVLVLDEIEQMFRHLLSSTTKLYRGQIFRVLVWLIRGAKQIICSDADLTGDLTVHLISKLRSNFEQDKIVSIINDWKTNRGIEVYENKSHLITELMVAAYEGKRLYIPVGELALANTLKSLLASITDFSGNPISVLVLTGETSDEAIVKKFFSNPNQEATGYQILIANSVLSTGVSIDVKWFDAVYGIFDRSVYTYQDCDQAISRVRNCPEVKVWIHRGIKQIYHSENALRSGPVRKELMTRSYTNPDADGKLSDGDELYMDIDARIQWCEQQWKDNRVEQFMDLKINEGWTVTKISANQQMVDAGTELLKFGKDPTGDKYEKKILAAPDLSYDEFEELKNTSSLRGESGRSLQKYWIAVFFEVGSPSNVTLAQIKAYRENNLREIVKNVKLLKSSRLDAIDRDRNQRENPKVTMTFTDFDHRALRRELLDCAQKASGIDYAEVLQRAKLHVDNEAEFAEVKKMHKLNSRPFREASSKRKQRRDELKWVIKQDQIDSLANYVSDDLDRVNLYFATNFKTPSAPESKTKVFNTIMGELGVELKKKRKGKDGESPEYFIDYDRVAELVATKDLSQII